MKEAKTKGHLWDWLKRKLMYADVGWMIAGPPKMSLSSAALSSA